MPSVPLLLASAALAAGVSQALVLLAALVARGRGGLASAAGAIGTGAGFFAGCWLLSRDGTISSWHWPPAEDQDRFLLLLLPAAVLAEALAALIPRAWMGWILRLAVAAVALRVLLHGSVYLTDAAAPAGKGWTMAEAAAHSAALAAALLAVWAAVVTAARRAPASVPGVVLAGLCGATAVTMMLAGYLTGGPAAVPLSGALVGATLAAAAAGTPRASSGAAGVGVFCLFCLLVSGHYFGSLDARFAGALFAVPLLCLLPSLPPLRGRRPWLAAAVVLVLTAVPAALVVAAQVKQRERDEGPSQGGAGAYSPSDYDFLEKK